MKNFSNILAAFVIGLLFVSMILNIVFIPKAIRKQSPVTTTETIFKTDTVFKEVEKQVVVEVPTLIYKDTSNIAVYADTIKNQDVDIALTSRVQGVLLSSKLDYKVHIPVYNTQTTQQTIKVQSGRLYGVGSLSTGLASNIHLGVIYVPGKSRAMFGYMYGISPGTHQLILGYKF